MVNKFEKLSESLNVDFNPKDFDEIVIEDEDVKKRLVPAQPRPVAIRQPISEDEHEAEKEDFQHSRQMLRDVIDMGKEAIEGIKDVASQSDEPRRYEVVAISIKSVTEAVKTLYDLHSTRKRVKEGRIEGPERQNISVDKAVFVGTGADFLEHIKRKQREKTIDHA